MISLPEEESKHCVKVLRMKEGDRFCVSNGKGSLFDAELLDANPKKAVASLYNEYAGYDNKDFVLEIAIAPTKSNDRTEWFLEKATEIGIDKVKLFASCHSERKVANVDRFRKVMIAALKQSIKSKLPLIEDVVSLETLVKQPFDGKKYIAYISENVTEQLCDIYKKGDNVLILIGPEGDFSPEEVRVAMDYGFIPVSLGHARLRTETAALVACHTVQLINQMKG
ncbi:MAG TPA: 16S rRNA (uracil(1498)-N(3))-methyltransferase [Bacteroidetes bacterium]|nr:16S rRNA (uracil(1498)-N(3))-methyltransferase [Candidatus Limimorpha avicola]